MMKRSLVYLVVGLSAFGLIHLLTTETRLFLGMERSLMNGFFFLREYDVTEQNPLVSDEAIIAGFDEEAIAVIGKWPWKRYVHAQFLHNVERFSPRAVMFDVLFIKPETAPPYVTSKFDAEPDLRQRVVEAFAEMDGQFAAALEGVDNVYIDLQLVEQPRPGLPDDYHDRIRSNEKRVESISQPVSDNGTPVVFHSLEPILDDFVRNAHPVVINILSDDDGVTRSFPLYYTYRMSDGSYRNVFTVALALIQRYYRVRSEDIILRPKEIVLRSAKAPVLEGKTRRPAVSLRAFPEIEGRIRTVVPPQGHPYNRNLLNFLVNQLVMGVQTDEKAPLFPLHLLEVENGQVEVLGGWEVLDAARRMGSRKVQAVFYREADIRIDTPTPGFFYINYAGREKRYLPDPETGEPIPITTIPTRSYKDVFSRGNLPDLPELDRTGSVREGYDWRSLEEWFMGYCEEKARAIYEKARRDAGGKDPDDDFLKAYMNRHPEEGRYFFYSSFFSDRGAEPGALRDLAGEYGDFGREAGQSPGYYFTEKEMVRSLMDVYQQEFEQYYGKFVFAGATAIGLGDIQQTPYGAMTGISTIVNAFNTLVTRNSLRMSWDIPRLDVIILLTLSLLCAFAYGLTSVRIGSLLFVAVLGGTLAGSVLLFDAHNLYVRTVPILISNVAIFVSIIMVKVLTEQRDKRFLKATFSSYLAPEIIEEMYASKTMPTLGGEARNITAFFTDIQGFSTFSEKLTAHQLVELINEYLTAMTDILMAEGGTLDKYEGDAIIAFFGAPMMLPDHPLRACRAALAMQRRLADLRDKWAGERQGPNEPDRNVRGIPPDEWRTGDKWPLIVHQMRMRIGINTGEIVVGNMGSSMRMNYTMMGDPVNLAARLEAAAKQYGVYVLVSEYALEQEIVDGDGRKGRVADAVETRFIDRITVVGKSEPVRIYELASLKGELTEQEAELHRVFERAIGHYLRMEWDEAIARFKESLSLERMPDARINPSLVYIERCQAFKESPPMTAPGQTWDGVYRLTRK